MDTKKKSEIKIPEELKDTIARNLLSSGSYILFSFSSQTVEPSIVMKGVDKGKLSIAGQLLPHLLEGLKNATQI